MKRLAVMERIEAKKQEEQRLQELIRQQQEKDRLSWQRAERINTVAACQEYKQNNKNGSFINLADTAINDLKEREVRRLEYERRKGEVLRLAQAAGDHMIYKVYDNGINKRTIVNDWSFEKGGVKGLYLVNVKLTWNGDWIASNYYKASGIITFLEDGSDLKWTTTYVNPILAKYIDDINGAKLGIELLKSLSDN